MAKTLFKNIKELKGIIESDSFFRKGEQMNEVASIKDAYLIIEDDTIVDYGSMGDLPEGNYADKIDAAGSIIMPSFVDSHTHIVFATPREEEYVLRIKGASYEEIAESGGGILNSAKKLQQKSEEELYKDASKRLEEVIGYGTGAIEIKSGYGLTVDSEMKMLRVIKRLKENYDIPIKRTFLGAHAVPAGVDRRDYIKSLIEEMLPIIDQENLADYIDVFCDKGFFTVEETAEILEAGRKIGLKAKIHANELANSGGVQVGIAHDAISVDHLEMIEQAEIDALKKSSTIPTALPSCSFFLGIPYAPARNMIDQGLGVVLATDYNPGSSPSGKIPFLLSLACTKMKLTPNEAFNAVTINAAHALEMADKVGSITRGKWANIIMTKPIKSFDFIPYAFGTEHIDRVWIKGNEQIF